MLRPPLRLAGAARLESTLAARMREASGDLKTMKRAVPSADDVDVHRDANGEPFREMFVMPRRKLRAQMSIEQQTGRAEWKQRSRFDIGNRLAVRKPRSETMEPDQDWPNVWPAARSFNASVVPLPVRMGARPNPERRAPFKKQGNLELVKIPNFLHLTPAAIQRHCEAIKKFCTPFPAELKKEEAVDQFLPMSLYYNDYVHQGSSIRDPRSRVVTTTLKVKHLGLTDAAYQKIQRLAGQRYDEATDTLTILTDRCHTRKQNDDYGQYLLTVLYHEAHKVEQWEQQATRVDALKLEFEGSASKEKIISLLRRAKDCDALSPSVQLSADSKGDEPELQQFAEKWNRYRNEKESPASTRSYAESVKSLLGIPKLV
ncbi:unnamed protein product, partial [Mesorhabditis spiculigera]